MNSAICISGLTRTYKKTFPSFFSNIAIPLRQYGPVDIFISIWDSCGLGALDDKLVDSQQSVDDIIATYSPLAIEVESFKSIKHGFNLGRFTSRPCPVPAIIKEGILLSMPAQYKVLRCSRLKQDAEIMAGRKYDLVVRTRFDFVIDSPLRVQELDLNKINCLYNHDGLMGDYFYLSNSANMDSLCEVFSNYVYLLNINNSDMGPERNLRNHADQRGLSSCVMKRYNFALVRDTFRQEYHWNESSDGYRPV